MGTFSTDGKWHLLTPEDPAPDDPLEVYSWPTCLKCGASIRTEWLSLHTEWHDGVR